MNRSKFKKIFIIVLAVLLTLGLLAAATRYWQDAGALKVLGTVRNPEGKRLRGIQLKICTYDEDKDVLIVLSEGVSNLFGRFRLPLENPVENAILVVDTGEGEGRMVLPPILETVNHDIFLPIVETVVLFHDNDLHFNYNHPEMVKVKINQIKKEYDNVYLFNAGDIFARNRRDWVDYDGQQKDYEWYGNRCLFMIETMNEIGYDAMTAGNHDFVFYDDYTGKALEAAHFPILAANVKLSTDLLPPVLPYVFFKTNTYRKIAVLGLTTGLSKKAGNELNFFETAEEYLYLSGQSDIFIALTHLEVDNDIELARRYPEFDVIIGGHSHTLLEKGLLINDVLIVQAGGTEDRLSLDYPKYLGQVVLTLENGKIVDKKARVFKFENVDENYMRKLLRS